MSLFRCGGACVGGCVECVKLVDVPVRSALRVCFAYALVLFFAGDETFHTVWVFSLSSLDCSKKLKTFFRIP